MFSQFSKNQNHRGRKRSWSVRWRQKETASTNWKSELTERAARRFPNCALNKPTTDRPASWNNRLAWSKNEDKPRFAREQLWQKDREAKAKPTSRGVEMAPKVLFPFIGWPSPTAGSKCPFVPEMEGVEGWAESRCDSVCLRSRHFEAGLAHGLASDSRLVSAQSVFDVSRLASESGF